jgi:hypothetical protein
MHGKYLFWITGTAILAVIVGCSSLSGRQETMLDRNWGRSYESAKYNQILNPNAAQKKTPAAGLDGLASEANTAKYRKSFATDAPPPAADAKLSNIGQITGGK